jgi:ubiquinone/menaquinone biosynthesis C-methylase UbiE
MKTDQKAAIRNWWANAPMTYAEQHGSVRYRRADGSFEEVELGSQRFFELADEVFYSWNQPQHTTEAPFGRLFDYARHRGKRVLEVGCGMGCMAMNWAKQGALVTAVDLNPTSITQTRQRFASFGLEGEIREADAESLPFSDETFDYAYSWGVLHHTPGIRTALQELHRVLKPGAEIGVMLYHRHSFLYLSQVLWQEGYVNLESLFLDPLELGSRYGDGAREEGNPHTWPVTKREVRRDLMPQFADLRIAVLGTDVPHTLNTWWPGLGNRLPEGVIKALARRWGWSLWITARKARV